jgi:CBS domain-containing protein
MPGGGWRVSEFHDEYSESLESEFREIREALLSQTIQALGPGEPVCLEAGATVTEAVGRMTQARQAGVLVVDGEGRLAGIFTERDVLRRVVAEGRDVRRTALGDVMTRDPEVLSVRDRVARAVNQMAVAGYRTVPLVDEGRRPVGIVTATHVIKWMADLFPEAVLNMRPGDVIKHPSQVDAG